MITGEKKQQVDNIWQTFWNNGFTQPSAIFEQITYLLFMKMLDEKQLEKEAIANLTNCPLVPDAAILPSIYSYMSPIMSAPSDANSSIPSTTRDNQGDELLNIDNRNRYRNEIFHGSDSDASMMRIGCMNMMLHDVDEPQLHYRNSLSNENNDTNKYTLCLANPPFAGSLDADDIAHTLKAAVKTKKTELLFLALMMRMLQTGGRCASVVPDTVLTGDAQAYKTIRSALVDNHCLQAVITMPSGVFQPYSGVSTAIINLHQDRNGWNEQGLVLRYACRWLFSNDTTHSYPGAKRCP